VCPVQDFHSDRRLRKGDLQPALDKLAAKVKGWNRENFSKFQKQGFM
jgi:hypothetical protein